MNKLALTTSQVKVGLMVDTAAGPRFMPWQLALASVAAFALAVVLRLAVDTLSAHALLWRLAWANVEYHAYVFSLGVDVVLRGLQWAFFTAAK